MPTLRRSLAAAFALATLTAPAQSALANIAAPMEDPARLGGPHFVAKTPLIVKNEKLSFQCEEVEDVPVCAFEARYQIENPGAEPAGGRAAFYGIHAEEVAIKVDGRPAKATLSPGDVQALDAEVKAAEAPSFGSPVWQEKLDWVSRDGFDLSVPPSGRAEIVVTGRIKPGRTIHSRGYEYTSLQSRHLLLHVGEKDTRDFLLHYLLSPIKTWGGVHRMEVSIRRPTSWSSGAGIYGTPDRTRAQWQERTEGKYTISSTTIDGRVDPEAVGNLLSVHFYLPGDTVEHGGPFVGVGGVLGSSEARGFRMRFGYEIAAPSWAIYSLTADTDYKDRLVIAPQVEAATPQATLIPILPSLSLGVGVPVQILPKATVGARLIGSLQLWAVGFVTTVDLYPGLPSEEGGVQVTMIGRVSL